MVILRVLILNQAFHPDVVSTAQHASDLACALAAAGEDVTVVAGRRGYDDATRHFAPRESWRGVHILRVAGTRFGKRARWRRALDFASFLAACAWKLLWLPRQDVVIAMTSPPLVCFLGALLLPWKARELVFWCMDLNPDEAIAAGWLGPRSLAARLLASMFRYGMRRARSVIALDRYMAARLAAKGVPAGKITVLVPWSHDEDVRFSPAARAAFRARHGLSARFVVMYSGNHSPCHPLDTLLSAAEILRDDAGIGFCFIGGGSEFQKVKKFAAEHQLPNILCLPYQPRAELAASLSAADLHVVVMGEAFVGIVHPCKIYNILALGTPVLYIGPAPSHITDLLADPVAGAHAIQRHHGDAPGVADAIKRARDAGWAPAPSIPKGVNFSGRVVLPRFVHLITRQPVLRPLASPAAGEELSAVQDHSN